MRRFARRARVEGFRQLGDNARWVVQTAWRTHASLVVGLIAVTVAGGLIPAAAAVVMRKLINDAVEAAGQATQGLGPLLPWLVLSLGLTIAGAVTGLADRFLTQCFADEVDLDVNSQILEHAARLDVALFEDLRFQDTIHLAQRNTAKHVSQLLSSTLSFSRQLVQTVSLAAVLAAIEPWVIAAWIPFASAHTVFQWRLSQRLYLEEYGRAFKRRWSRYFVSLLTSRRSVAEVKLLALAPILIERFRSLMAEFRDQNRRIYQRAFVGDALFSALTSAAFFFMLAWVYRRFLQGTLPVGDVVVFGTVGLRLRGVLQSTVSAITGAMEHALYVSNLRDFLSIEPRIEPALGLTPTVTRGEIEFRDVTFTYPGADRPALVSVSFRVAPGETVALVGRNGAGKTTLVKLIARFYDPDSGSILLDRVDLRDLALDYLHRQMSFVFQNLGRYEATAADNIAYGDWQRLLQHRERVQRIAEYAGVGAMIEGMPQAYDTLLGRRFGEYDLSVGQWQQMAIARASARNATVLILDEPTSNLDAAAEYKLFQRFRQLAEGKTTILISQRFTTVSMADRIIVLDEGQVVETGAHRALLDKDGHYAALYYLQCKQMGFSPDES